MSKKGKRFKDNVDIINKKKDKYNTQNINNRSDKYKKNREKTKVSHARIIINSILIIILIYSSINIIMWFLNTSEDKNNLDDLKKEVSVVEENIAPKENMQDNQNAEETSTLKSQIDFDKLYQINNEIKGWIIIKELGIDYPVLQHTDNDYYLKRDFNKKVNKSGSIYLDYRNNEFKDQKTVVYGHNMRNGTMFASLAKIVKKEVEPDIKIYIETKNEIYEYQVFSAYRIPTSDFYRNESIEKMIKNSEIESSVEVKTNDKILTLYTCTNTSDSRIIVHSVLVKVVEK